MGMWIGSFVLALRWGVLGWLWGAGRGGRRRDAWQELGRASAVGLLLNLLPALALASFQAWTPALDWAAWGMLAAAGALRAYRGGFAAGPRLARGGLAVLALWAAMAVPLSQAPRTERLAGGQDPGIYLGNAVAIARDNGLGGRTESIFSDMPVERLDLFARASGDYREIFPGVPVRAGEGSLPLFFFHLTPLCGAWLLRMGGMELLFRMPAILGWAGLLPALALGGLWGWRGWRRGAFAACWALAPTWWYHQGMPTSEMLYLFLLLSGALLYFQSREAGGTVPWGAMAALFAAVANHLNVAVLAGVFLAAAGAGEAQARAPGRVRRVLLCWAAVGLGIAYDAAFAGWTVLKLQETEGAMHTILAAYAAGGILALAAAWRPLPPVWRARAGTALGYAGAAAGAGLAVVALAAGTEAGRVLLLGAAGKLWLAGTALGGVVRAVPFTGAGAVAWAGAGLAWLSLDRKPQTARLRGWALALAVVCAALYVHPGIAAIYPWALRRTVAFWVPLLALGQAYAAIRAVELLRARRRAAAGAAGLLLACMAAAAAQSVGIAAAAARVREYAGMGELLARIDAVLRPGDVVVADDPMWGTPLLLAHGRDVVNGRRLWRGMDPVRGRERLDALADLRAGGGRRVLWLTSTGAELALYPARLGATKLWPAPIPYEFGTVAQGARARTYGTETRRRDFQLHEWDGTYTMDADVVDSTQQEVKP
jgi:hypothetical protein